MHSLTYLLVLVSFLYTFSTALDTPLDKSPFSQTTPSNETSLLDLFDQELLRRSRNVVADKVARQVITVTVAASATATAGGACANSWHACSALGAPGLCCPANAVCAADYNGQVACCPSGSVCTGVAGQGTTRNGVVVVATSTVLGAVTNTVVVGVVPSTTSAGQATNTGGSGFIVAAGTTVALIGSAARPTALISSLVLVMVLFTWRG